MTEYVVAFILVGIASPLTEPQHGKRGRLAYVVLVFGYLFALSALRGPGVGTDTFEMDGMVQRAVFSPWSMLDPLAELAPLYYTLAKLLAYVIPAAQVHQVLTSLIVMGVFAFVIYKESDDVALSSWLFLTQYIFFTALNVARQYAAVALVFLALYLSMRRNTGAAVVAWLAAVGVHSSALAGVLVLLAGGKERKSSFYVAIVFVSAAVALALPQALGVVSQLLPRYGELYVHSGAMFEQGHNRKVMLTLFHVGLLLYAFGLYCKAEPKMGTETRARYKGLLMLVGIGLVMELASLSSLLMSRIGTYYSCTLLLLLPLALAHAGRERAFATLCLAAVMLVPAVVQLLGNAGGVVPYLFCWE